MITTAVLVVIIAFSHQGTPGARSDMRGHCRRDKFTMLQRSRAALWVTKQAAGRISTAGVVP
jgi:hypothetical protein